MRIVYGVHGYGLGHATRSMAVLPSLCRRHDVLILAGGDAYQAIGQEFPVSPVPALGYRYRSAGQRSTFLTLRAGLPVLFDVLDRGPTYTMVENLVHEFSPDLIITDAEVWTAWVGKRLQIPRISFDHYGLMAYFSPTMGFVDRMLNARDARIYRLVANNPERILVSSFYDAPANRSGVKIIPPLLRKEVLDIKSTQEDHLLVYLNNGKHLYTDKLHQTLTRLQLPVVVYGTPKVGREGNVEFRPRGNQSFLKALASCRALICTAGNQLVGEAIYYRKPLLVMPEDCVEQRCNALAVERMNIGRQTILDRLSAEVIHAFLAEESTYRENMEPYARDGSKEALDAIEEFASELVDFDVSRTEGRSVA
ncbi:MAG: glycosyltransferase family protein [Phycisphaerae bacterium]